VVFRVGALDHLALRSEDGRCRHGHTLAVKGKAAIRRVHLAHRMRQQHKFRPISARMRQLSKKVTVVSDGGPHARKSDVVDEPLIALPKIEELVV
jgi:hypothetical protein